MRLVPEDRAALCDLFAALGPEAPTVLPGWRAEELLAHMLVRERQPLYAPGILVPALAGRTEAAMRSYDKVPWSRRVDLLRGGAPPWSPYWLAPIDEKANLVEFFVHYEDLARAQPDWRPRELSPERQEALWSMLRLSARVLYRRSPVGVLLRHPTRERGTDIHARPGSSRVTITAPPGELLLHAFGREQARVELDGAPQDLEALARTPRGI